jgi:micrococcal nuclease
MGLDAPEANENDKRDIERTGRDRQTILALGRQASAFAAGFCRSAPSSRSSRISAPETAMANSSPYVWTADRAMVNLVILREGYAQVLTVRPNLKYQAVLLSCQREAREAGRGLWGQP